MNAYAGVKAHRNFQADLNAKAGISALGAGALYMADRTSYDAGLQLKMLATSLEKAFESGLNEPVGKERSDLICAVVATLESISLDLKATKIAIELAESEIKDSQPSEGEE